VVNLQHNLDVGSSEREIKNVGFLKEKLEKKTEDVREQKNGELGPSPDQNFAGGELG